VRAKPSTPAGDIAAEAMLAVALPSRCSPWRCRVDVSHGVMSLPGRAGDGAAEATLVGALPSRCWLWHDVTAESF
jgi:hypothetical protein